MVISKKWNTYREDDIGKATHVKTIIFYDSLLDKMNCIFCFTRTICDMLQLCDTLYLIYDMWDSMISESYNFNDERVEEGGTSSFYTIV